MFKTYQQQRQTVKFHVFFHGVQQDYIWAKQNPSSSYLPTYIRRHHLYGDMFVKSEAASRIKNILQVVAVALQILLSC